MIKTPSKKECINVLNRIRELWIQSGGEPIRLVDALVEGSFPSESGGIELIFDYGTPTTMYTPHGYIPTSLGGNRADTDDFWELFTKEYNVEIIRPKRDDAKVSKCIYTFDTSGPHVRLEER
tara:strand:+ start:12717 stop:13082 length:366 start_codon:yes stop_codon:yes gene_type:complete